MKNRVPCLLMLCGVLMVSACRQGHAPAKHESGPHGNSIQPTLKEKPSPAILFLGNSLSAGLGVQPEDAFPARIQNKIKAEGWDFRVINAGLSGDTSAGGLRRISWMLRQHIDVLVLELGGNDGLRGISPEVTHRNLQAIIDTTHQHYPKVRVVLAGMQVPPNLGEDYTTRFRNIYSALNRENDLTLIPFLLENVGGIPSLNQPDGIHPNAEGHRIVAETVWKYLRPVLEAERATSDGRP